MPLKTPWHRELRTGSEEREIMEKVQEYEQILPGYHKGLPDEFEKLKELIELDQFELLEDGFRLVYLMNDAVESFLVFENARMTGTYDKEYEGEIQAFLECQESGYALVIHQGSSVFTLFFQRLSLEVHLYNYGETGHFWVKGYEYLRQIEYKIAILRDKYRYLGEKYCSHMEKKLVALAEFPPLNYCCYPAVSPKYQAEDGKDWTVTKEAFDLMFSLAEEASDEGLRRALKRYQRTLRKSDAKKIARMFHENRHKKSVDILTQWIIKGASEYENRSFGDEDFKYNKVYMQAEKRRKQLQREGKEACILREEPFIYARDSIEFKVYLMIWKAGIWNRKVELEVYSAEPEQSVTEAETFTGGIRNE